MAVVAVPWILSDLETTQEIRGLEPAPIFCTTAITVSKNLVEDNLAGFAHRTSTIFYHPNTS